MIRAARSGIGAALAATTLFLGSYPVNAAAAQDKPGSYQESEAGIRFRLQASEKEIGLPIYPGAKPHRDGDSPAANIGLWGKTFAFKLVVLKMESADSQAKVAAFYQKALAKYGKVLDCSQNQKNSDEQSTKKSLSVLSCEEDTTPDNGGMVFKSGTKNKQHIVSIEQDGQGCIFHMMLLDMRGIDEEQHAQ